jgi:hypothetical protein
MLPSVPTTPSKPNGQYRGTFSVIGASRKPSKRISSAFVHVYYPGLLKWGKAWPTLKAVAYFAHPVFEVLKNA